MKHKLLLAAMVGAFAFGSMNALALSDDIYSFEFELDGEEYALPMTYADFVSHGWTTSDDASTELSPNQYTWLYLEKGDLRVTVDVINLSMNSLPVDQCDVGGFEAEAYNVDKAPGTKLVLPSGIEFGVATLDDITAAYGPASDTYESDSATTLTYSQSVYQDIQLRISKETGVIENVDFQNFDEEKCATASLEADVSDEVPAAVLAYKAPTELGEDINSNIVEFAGDLYSIPCPVSVMIENGWTVSEKPEEVVAGKQSGWITLMKDNQNFHTLLRNYDANATAIENCFVTEVKSSTISSSDPNISLTLQKNITIGMSNDDLLTALAGIECETDDSSDTFIYYTIYTDEDSKMNSIQLVVNKEENAIVKIEVENLPKSIE